MNNLSELRIEPSDISEEERHKLQRMFDAATPPRLIGTDGQIVALPEPFNHMFSYMLKTIEGHQAVVAMPEEEALTTQVAANFLGMSRPYLLRLLESGKLPFHHVGSHRRILLKDLLEFQKKRSLVRNKALAHMTKELVDAGLYDQVVQYDEED